MSERNNTPPIDEHGYVDWAAPLESFSGLSPSEILAIHRSDLASDTVVAYLSSLAFEEQDFTRLSAVMAAFLDSPLPEDRSSLASGTSYDLIRAGHRKAGLAMWHRLVSDESEDVRNHAYEHVEEILDSHISQATKRDWPSIYGPQGFYSVDLADEQQLFTESGLTRQEVYDLTLSHAYAENGDHFNLGRAALAKLQGVQPPTEQRF